MWTEWADVRVLCFYIVPIAGYLQVVKLAEKERRECKFRFLKFHSDGITPPSESQLDKLIYPGWYLSCIMDNFNMARTFIRLLVFYLIVGFRVDYYGV